MIGDFRFQTSLSLVHPDAPGGLKFGKHELAPQLQFAAGDSTLWIGDSELPVLVRVRLGEDSIRRIDLPIEQRKWDENAISRIRSRLESSEISAVSRDFQLAELDPEWRPERPPYFRQLAADAGDGVWIELFREDPASRPEYLVLNGVGRPVARVRLPRPGRLTEVGLDYVLVIERDEFDVERLVEYHLAR